MADLKIALVGCGLHADAHVAGLLAARDAVEVTAVCDLDVTRAEQRGKELGAEGVFTDYEQLLRNADVEAVLLCLPHLLHAPATIAAARAGKHILVEKPIATTLADADAMIAAAREAGVTLMVAHNQRFFPEHQRIQELLDEDAIGPIFSARADHNQAFQPPDTHWIRRQEEAGGGAFIGYGVHRIDLLRWFAGEVTEVAHFDRHLSTGFSGEIASVTILRFESGAVGEISVNWHVKQPPWMDMVFLSGEDGSIHNVGGLHVDGKHGSGPIDVPAGNPFERQLRHFVESVVNRTPPLTSGPEARRTLEVCLAGYQSAASGQVVRLSGSR